VALAAERASLAHYRLQVPAQLLRINPDLHGKTS